MQNNKNINAEQLQTLTQEELKWVFGGEGSAGTGQCGDCSNDNPNGGRN